MPGAGDGAGPGLMVRLADLVVTQGEQPGWATTQLLIVSMYLEQILWAPMSDLQKFTERAKMTLRCRCRSASYQA